MEKVGIVLAEGVSEVTLFNSYLNQISDYPIIVESFNTDITTYKQSDGMMQVIYDKLASLAENYDFSNKKIVFINLIVDLDGCYLDENHIIESEVKSNESQYKYVRSKERTLMTFKRKKDNISYLRAISKIKDIPFQIYYCNENLDDVILNNPNLSKEKYRKYDNYCLEETFSAFRKVIEQVSVSDNYDKSWEYITQSEHALERATNLNLLLKEIYLKEVSGVSESHMPYVERLLNHKNNGFIKVLGGLANPGKDAIFQKYINELLKLGVNREQIIFFDLADSDNNYIHDIDDLEFEINKLINSDHVHYIFLENIENLTNISNYLINLNDYGYVDLYVSCNDRHFVNSLTEQFQNFIVRGLSLHEYYEQKRLSPHPLFVSYLKYGSFDNISNLQALFDEVFLKNILLYANVDNPQLMLKLIKYLMRNITKELDLKQVANTLKIDLLKLHNYLNVLVDSYLFDDIIVDHKNDLHKYYLLDLGFRFQLLGVHNHLNKKAILENSVYNELAKLDLDISLAQDLTFISKKDDETFGYLLVEHVDETIMKNLLTKTSYHKIFVLTNDEINERYENIIILNVIHWLVSNKHPHTH